MEEIVTNGWNDIQKYAPPLNKEIFMLNGGDLSPVVGICRMTHSSKVTWSTAKRGMVLCYDVPSGGYHSCNGAHIRYWKEIDRPYVKDRPEQDKIQVAVETLLKLPVKERYSLLFDGKVDVIDELNENEHEAYLQCKDSVKNAIGKYVETTGHDLSHASKIGIKNIVELGVTK